MAKTVAHPIYQLKITLTGVKPPVWRRLHVPGSVNLKKLHQILQVAFAWTDSHLHEFEGAGQSYGTPHSEYPNTTRNEARVRLNEVLLKEKDSMVYVYDFGDGWEHKVVLEKIIPFTPDRSAPTCIAGARACPPDDCGGVGGYQALLEAIADPLHPEHEEMLEWIGGEFDPEHFDRDEINDELAASIHEL
jgi:hypothetical protein